MNFQIWVWGISVFTPKLIQPPVRPNKNNLEYWLSLPDVWQTAKPKQTINIWHFSENISAPPTLINLSIAASKLCCKAGSFGIFVFWPKGGSGQLFYENADTQSSYFTVFDPISGLYITLIFTWNIVIRIQIELSPSPTNTHKLLMPSQFSRPEMWRDVKI